MPIFFSVFEAIPFWSTIEWLFCVGLADCDAPGRDDAFCFTVEFIGFEDLLAFTDSTFIDDPADSMSFSTFFFECTNVETPMRGRDAAIFSLPVGGSVGFLNIFNKLQPLLINELFGNGK